MSLDVEMETFRRELPNLLKADRGRFVLIKGHDVVGVYDTDVAAVQAGDQRFVAQPFLVKQIQEKETPLVLHAPLVTRCPS